MNSTPSLADNTHINPIYDKIGQTYDLTRKADPELVKQLYQQINAKKESYYLDIGCGSGNYTCALAANGLAMIGIDISSNMLIKAKAKNPTIHWIHGDARKLPFHDQLFAGATCILATHHIINLDSTFREIFRVLKQGQFVIFTSTPEQMQHYWLWHYFPKMMAASCKPMQSLQTLKQLLQATGFINITTEAFFVTNTLQDWFLHAGKYRPQIYLDAVVRAGISSFANLCSADEEKNGIKKLAQDIESGKIKDIISSYSSNDGDYLFITATKES